MGPSTASSATTGFFQTFPQIQPQYTAPELAATPTPSDDAVLARVLRLYLSPQAQASVGASVHRFSRRVLEPSVLRHAVDAETDVPTLHAQTTFGAENRDEPLRTGEGWKALKAIGVEEGVVTRAYDDDQKNNRRVEQFALGHVWSHTSTLTMCPMSMTDGAAALLRRYLRNGDDDGDQPGRSTVLAETYRRLTSADPREAWTSGQWMTERTGGSDVSGTETVARRLTEAEEAGDAATGRDRDAVGLPLGPWCVDGFKWFSSATDSDVAVLLARTPSGGLGAFLMPMRRRVVDSDGTTRSELNGVRIQRLKDKLGTRGLPTAELELRGARAWMLGHDVGGGVREMAALLNVTRIHTATGSASYWSRGLSVCRAYSKVRSARGRLLADHPQHLAWMAGETVRYWAATQFAFFGAALMGCGEQGGQEDERWGGAAARDTVAGVGALLPRGRAVGEGLLRLLLPVMKAQVSVAAVGGLRAAMECLGGVGYCENHDDGGVLNLARLFRDSVANTIWEGTGSVMAEDVRRVLADRRIGGGDAVETMLATWVRGVLDHCAPKFPSECRAVEDRLQVLVALVHGSDAAELEFRGREILGHLEAVSCAAILLFDAVSDGDEVAAHVASRYVESIAPPSSQFRPRRGSWKRESEIDSLIFLGEGHQTPGKL